MKKEHSPIEFFAPDLSNPVEIQHVAAGISAGFPSPAMDFMETRLDVSKLLIKNPLTTFYARVSGTSMTGAGINDGDILVVDRSLRPEHKSIAVCHIDGEFTVKRLLSENGELFLKPENDQFRPLKISEHDNFSVWGIVTHVISKV